LSAVFDRLIKTHISLRLGDGSSLGALWELSGSSLGALWELVAVAGIYYWHKHANPHGLVLRLFFMVKILL
jgi:hypothetical protein